MKRHLFTAVLLIGAFSGVVQAKDVDLDVSFYQPDTSFATLPNPDVHGEVKHVILMIGDGMGLGHVALARFAAVGPDGRLTIERMPVTGLVCTQSANELITDSGAAATAMATGVKTNNRSISVRPDGDPLPTILELARKQGLATGLVVTSTVTHATPACFAARELRRADEDKIAADMAGSGTDVILGGGLKFWVGRGDSLSRRADDRDLVREMQAKGYTFVHTREGMEAVDEGRLLGLFEYGPMTTRAPEPTLSEMTDKALELLPGLSERFFMMVEGSQIDWAAHDNDPNGIVYQLLNFDLAVREAIHFAQQDGHTLVLVTADHETGGVTIVGGEHDGSGLDAEFSTGHHTATPVVIFAYGPGSDRFTGVMDNTEIARKVAALLHVEGLADKDVE